KLLDAERLGEIVVGARVDPLDAFRPGGARGENEDRHLAAGGAPALQDGEPVHPGKAEIEDDEVVILRVAAEPGVLAIGGDIADIAGGVEGRRHIGADARLILDHEYPHQSSSSILRTFAVFASTSISLRTPCG